MTEFEQQLLTKINRLELSHAVLRTKVESNTRETRRAVQQLSSDARTNGKRLSALERFRWKAAGAAAALLLAGEPIWTWLLTVRR